jgi:superfamily I DNA and RNA helicase
MTKDESWQDTLRRKVRDAKIEVIGQDDVKNYAHAAAVIGILSAFGDSSAGFVYIEPCTPSSTAHPADILLCHPDVGLLVIEVKGYTIDFIERIQAGHIFFRADGYVRSKNPVEQVRSTMFDILNSIRKIIPDHHDEPLVNWMIAFPNISRTGWRHRGFHECLPMEQILLKDHFETPAVGRDLINQLVRAGLEKTRRSKPMISDHLEIIKRAFGDSATINVTAEERTVRKEVEDIKLGAFIDDLVIMEKNLSREQEELSRLNVQGYARLVRGVAGSGKTIVLANQTCRFIKRKFNETGDLFQGKKREFRVAAICFNRSLVQFISKKIKDAYKQQTLEGLPPNVLFVSHFEGLLFQLASDDIESPITYIPYSACDKKIRAQRYLKSIQELREKHPDTYDKILYDAIFVDEGQDLDEEEFQVLHELVRPDPATGERTLIIFYDDAQNLYGRQRPNWAQLGIDLKGRSHVMRECFRNTKEIISLAFNVLLGAQAPEDQKVKTRTFADVNYLKQIELVEEKPDSFLVKFAERTHAKPTLHKFPNRSDEKKWIVREVIRLIQDEKVRPEDILILFYGPKQSEFQDLLGKFRDAKCEKIKGYVTPYNRSQDRDEYIFRKEHLTISTVNGAKGYDAHIVFLVGADLFETTNEGRAAFYVGATRAKLMLFVSGFEKGGSLLAESEKLLSILS